MKSNFSCTLVALVLFLLGGANLKAQSTYFYQLKVYHFRTGAQGSVLDSYLERAYLPALHRYGIKHVGVFKPIVADTAEKLIYVFVPYQKFNDIERLDRTLAKDIQYLTNGRDYLNAVYNAAPYVRMETILLKAFSAMPKPAVPHLNSPKNERVYELRSYEGATEQLSLNKIGMFNDHEVDIFTRLNFNAVFYGQVLAGSRMPNLMYLTTFNNRADRDQHWKDFGPAYKAIRDLPQYQNNVSKNVTLFLYPTEYSDF